MLSGRIFIDLKHFEANMNGEYIVWSSAVNNEKVGIIFRNVIVYVCRTHGRL